MSYTEIYKFNNDGDAEYFDKVDNAWLGAMMIWRILEKKYLPPLPKPSWMDQDEYEKKGYWRFAAVPSSLNEDREEPLKPVWQLFGDERLTREEKITLGTTFDRIITMKENLHEVIDAFIKFDEENIDYETNLKTQAEILKNALADDDLIAVGWNQTSICQADWDIWDDKKGEFKPYNIVNNMEHFDLFEDKKLKK